MTTETPTPTQIVAQAVEVMAESTSNSAPEAFASEMPVASHVSAEAVEVVETSETQAVESVDAAAVAVIEKATPAAIEPIQTVAQELAATEAPADLDTLLSQAGLQLVQTDASAVNYSAEPVAPVRQNPPRERKPRAVVEEEPLQLVETHNS